ncbi:MAG: hypothetical protein JWN84_2458, partial [Nocardioides sp.]|nr:hypothetical protein [Nocardioides sp.]
MRTTLGLAAAVVLAAGTLGVQVAPATSAASAGPAGTAATTTTSGPAGTDR